MQRILQNTYPVPTRVATNIRLPTIRYLAIFSQLNCLTLLSQRNWLNYFKKYTIKILIKS